MRRPSVSIILTAEEEAELERLPRWRHTETGLDLRVGIILDCAKDQEVADRHQTSQQTVTQRRRRFAEKHLQELTDSPRPEQPRRHDDQQVNNRLNRLHRFHRHFIPTYSSRMNLVERFFAALPKHQPRRGTNVSMVALERAIREYLDLYNDNNSRPAQWSKRAGDIIESVNSVIRRMNQT